MVTHNSCNFHLIKEVKESVQELEVIDKGNLQEAYLIKVKTSMNLRDSSKPLEVTHLSMHPPFSIAIIITHLMIVMHGKKKWKMIRLTKQ